LNLGIKKMSGEFFSWLSHDDLYVRSKIEDQIRCYQELGRNKHIIFSRHQFIDSEGNQITIGKEILPKANLTYQILYERFIGGCSLLIEKTAFEEVGLFDGSLRTTQDYDMWFRLIATGYQFHFLPKVLVHTRIHSSQTFKSIPKTHIKERDELFLKLLAKLPTHLWLDTAESKYLAYLFLGFQYYVQRLEMSSSYCFKQLKIRELPFTQLKTMKKILIIWARYYFHKLKTFFS